MAQLLYERDGTRKHLSATRRHMRLCRQYQGTQFLIDQIQLPYNALRDKHESTLKKLEEREDRYDDLLTADNQLDDQVRLVFRRCEEHDRASPAQAIMNQIFPEGKFGHIVNMNLQEEPDMVERLAMRLENLGDSHELYPLAAELRNRVTASRKAIKGYEDMIKQVKMAEAEEEIAQATLRRLYENNYLDARKQLGKIRAERLFPKLSNSARTVQTMEDEESSEDVA
ncbi:hypothetical protein WJR50_23570 [Catalinimonas sp. 4WD22]|uniref:hypothetical protein n=1 Tax=Catalinimonas locisalis TaxID=3133978 RepID=UPI003100EDFA